MINHLRIAMYKYLLLSLMPILSLTSMEKYPAVHEHEEYSLSLRPKSLSPLTAIAETASFKESNTFGLGEFVVIKNGLLACLEVNSKSYAKVVQIIDRTQEEYIFRIVRKKDDEGRALVYSDISIKNPELFGKVPQEIIPESLKN